MLESPIINRRRFSPAALKEPFCALSHYMGAVLSAVALVMLLVAAHGRFWPTLGGVVFGVSLVTLYLASALSHTWHAPPHIQKRLSQFDYVAIFLLIAGTYAPFCLGPFRHTFGWPLLGVEYGLALLGIANVVFWDETPHWIRVIVYVIMGWVLMLVWPRVQHTLPPAATHWLLAGGLCYTVGVAVLALDKPHLWPGRFSAHDLWHVFVLAGSACFFFLILRYIIAF